MEEPMEECANDAPTNGTPGEVPQNIVPPLLRPGSMVMMSITEEDYQREYWPKLEAAITQLLTMPPGQCVPISYEQMYSCVYKCVCKQFSERLFADLVNQITTYLETQSLELQQKEKTKYIETFNYVMKQYLDALGGIVPIFNYMNRFYVESKLRTDLNVELRKLFVTVVAEKHVPTLIPLLVDANTRPFSVSPPVMSSLITNLFDLNPEFAQQRPHLFAKYIPQVLPPCQESELARYMQEEQQWQRDLLTHPDFISGDSRRKRRPEEEPPKHVPLSFLPSSSSSS